MLRWFKKIIFSVKEHPATIKLERTLEHNVPFIWCLVGNVNRTNNYFSTGTKVYCLPIQWGDGYQKIKVIGRLKGKGRFICIVLDGKHITNRRLQKIFKPAVLKIMKQEKGWTDSDEHRERILQMLNE